VGEQRAIIDKEKRCWMAEIKSTLELVLERTRHLTLTEDEKREQAVAELKKSLRGLVQKCQDGAMAPHRFREELQRMQSNSQVDDRGIVFDEISRRLELEKDCMWPLNLLADVFGINPQGIRAISDEYRKALAEAAEDRIEKIRMELAENEGISGTAVVPNLADDREWVLEQQRIHERFKPIWVEELQKLKRTVLS
jgi:hypothetical protein